MQEINEKREVEVINLRKEVEVKEEESKEVQSKLSMVGINYLTTSPFVIHCQIGDDYTATSLMPVLLILMSAPGHHIRSNNEARIGGIQGRTRNGSGSPRSIEGQWWRQGGGGGHAHH